MDALVALGDHSLDAQQLRALGGPVARRTRAVFLAAEHDARRAVGDVLHGRVIDRHLLAGGLQHGQAAFDARAVGLQRQHQVLDAHVGECATHHDVMIAAAGAVGVEVDDADVMLEQVGASRGGRLDGAGRADVVGGDRVTEDAQCARTQHVAGGTRRHAEVGKERRFGDVGRLRPVVGLPGGGGNAVPQRIVLGQVAVELAEGLRVHGVLHAVMDLLAGGPDVADPHVFALLAFAERLGHQVGQDVAGDGVGDDQRRRRQEVGAQVRMDACLEVAVAGQHGGANQVVLHDGFLDRFRQRAGVADTGGAAITGQVEAEFFEVGQQACLGQVLGHDS